MGAFRLLLALSVVVEHGLTTMLGFHLIDAAGAVWVFFAISGFLITIALNRKYSGGPKPLTHFYWNRAIRLYPSYWVWLVLTIAVYSLAPHDWLTRGFHEDGSFQASGFWFEHASIASLGTLLVAAMANLTGLFADSLLSIGFDKSTGALVASSTQTAPLWAMAFMFIGQYWTIGVEICFYALAPLLCRGLLRVLIMFLLSASGVATKAWMYICTLAHVPPAILFLNAPKYIWIFMMGAALARAYLACVRGTKRDAWVTGAACVGMYCFIGIRHAELFLNPAFPWWEFSILTALVPLLFHFTGKNKFDKFAGDLSYPVYVNHFLIIQIASSFVAPSGLLYAVLSIGFACASVILVERPMRRWKFEGAFGSRPANTSQPALDQNR